MRHWCTAYFAEGDRKNTYEKYVGSIHFDWCPYQVHLVKTKECRVLLSTHESVHQHVDGRWCRCDAMKTRSLVFLLYTDRGTKFCFSAD